MKLIIDIPEEAYELLQNDGVDWLGAEHILDAVSKGTPLEKHDEEVIKETVESIWGKPPYTEVLDKIRAEIEALPKTYPFINHIDTYVKEDDVKKIIAKYRKGDKE